MVVGGITQYLTSVQGMPADIERRLEKRVRKYIWADKTMSPVNAETLYAPIEEGGRKVLDLKSRNQAIDIMWLKKYLNFGPDRPLWAQVTDAILAEKIPHAERTVPRSIRVNIYLQSWQTYQSARKVPRSARQILQTAKKYGLRLESFAIANEVLESLPIW
ncbi:hypothetical protein CPC08DRAFT_652222, partial [Agrocybe pediades]